MKSLRKRVRNVEHKLWLGDDQKGRFIILTREGGEDPVLGPVEEWITFKEAEAERTSLRLFVQDPAKELEARKKLRETEGERK